MDVKFVSVFALVNEVFLNIHAHKVNEILQQFKEPYSVDMATFCLDISARKTMILISHCDIK